MHILVIKNTQIILYIPCKNYIFSYKHSMELHLKFHYKAFHFREYFHYILQLIYQLFFFYTYNLCNLNIIQYHMIYYIHTHNY